MIKLLYRDGDNVITIEQKKVSQSVEKAVTHSFYFLDPNFYTENMRKGIEFKYKFFPEMLKVKTVGIVR